MKIEVQRELARTPLLVIFLAEGEKPPTKPEPAAVASVAIKHGDFTGKFRETALLYAPGDVERILLIGLGNPKKIDAETLRRAAALAEKRAQALKLEHYALSLPRVRGRSARDLGELLAEGTILASYRFAAQRRDKAEDGATAPKSMTILAEAEHRALEDGVRRGVALAAATNLARDLCNSPANVATPSHLAERARELSGNGIRCRVYDRAELEKMKMGGILGVARGSAEPPCLIKLEYAPKGAKDTVCLVGKGLTFDSGGISIKPAKGMEEMKYDMSGGATVLGVFKALSILRPKTRVIGIIPSTENMPGGRAIKPGDVLTTYGGLSVEVINTDAEGRLILADALEFAKTLKPTVTIDLATLTGAVVIALGHDLSGLFCNDDKLRRAIEAAAARSGERVWHLPIVEEYADGMKSDVADIANTGGKGAGSIMAAYFLSRFAAGMRWAHLDIAGTAWDQRARDYYEKGSSGVGVRLLSHLIENWSKAEPRRG
ncbi:MAG: leucyl aminopeptidase [Planctomycetota bacterium]